MGISPVVKPCQRYLDVLPSQVARRQAAWEMADAIRRAVDECGATQAEIARHLGITPTGVREKLLKGRRQHAGRQRGLQNYPLQRYLSDNSDVWDIHRLDKRQSRGIRG